MVNAALSLRTAMEGPGAGEAKQWTMKVRDEMTKIEERKEIPQGIASLRTASIYRALAGAESPALHLS